MNLMNNLKTLVCSDCGWNDHYHKEKNVETGLMEEGYEMDSKICRKCQKPVCYYCQKTHGCMGFTLFGMTHSDLYSAGKRIGII